MEKNQTTTVWMFKTLKINGIFAISTGAGFLIHQQHCPKKVNVLRKGLHLSIPILCGWDWNPKNPTPGWGLDSYKGRHLHL